MTIVLSYKGLLGLWSVVTVCIKCALTKSVCFVQRRFSSTNKVVLHNHWNRPTWLECSIFLATYLSFSHGEITDEMAFILIHLVRPFTDCWGFFSLRWCYTCVCPLYVLVCACSHARLWFASSAVWCHSFILADVLWWTCREGEACVATAPTVLLLSWLLTVYFEFYFLGFISVSVLVAKQRLSVIW